MLGALSRKRGAQLGGAAHVRSEEHTSELQSHLNLVCRLLLEKKKVYHLIIELARGHGYTLDAEAVETRADFSAATELGFDSAHHYRFTQPMRLHKFARSALHG